MNGRLRLALRFLLDRLGPVTLRDLRQKVRGKSFTGAFIALHALTVLAMLPLLLIDGARASQGSGRTLFWTPMAFVLILAVPAVIANEMRQERSGGMLELVLVSGINPRRILWGKWGANVVFALLLSTSLLPYGIVRYFLGGVDLVIEGIVYANILSVALYFVALAAGLSVWRRFDFAALAAGLSGIATYIALQSAFFMSLSTVSLRRSAAFGAWSVPLCILTLGAIAACMIVELGTRHLTARTERESWPARLLALTAVAICLTLPEGMPDELLVALLIGVAFVVFGVLVSSLCEERQAGEIRLPRWLARIPFSRYFLTPGWDTGVLFSIVLVASLTAILDLERKLGVLALALGALYMPLLGLRIATRGRGRPRFTLYLLLQAVFLAPAVLYGLGAATQTGWMKSLGEVTAIFTPLSFLLAAGAAPSKAWTEASVAAGHVVAATIIVMTTLVALRSLWRSRSRR